MSNLHVLVLDGNGEIYHTMRSSETTGWTTFNNVFQIIGYPPYIGGLGNYFSSVGCAVDSTTGDLHVCGTDRYGVVWHAIRSASPPNRWSAWGNVTHAGKGTFAWGAKMVVTAFSASTY
jgi:hypothetical protein